MGGHLYVQCRSVCELNKAIKALSRDDQGIKVTSELQKSKNQEHKAAIWPLNL